jgi:hypothetical protein
MRKKITRNAGLGLVAFALGLLFPSQVIGQDTIPGTVKKIQSDLSILSRLKFSGFVQAQYQKADTIGVASYAAANFTGLDSRFNVRRGRLKAVYSGDNAQVAVQFDLKENGVFAKEAYGVYTEPWLKTFSLTGGFFNRPIGNEVEYSSSSLESPERARITQILFPDESDLGAKITIQAPKSSPWNFIKLDAGLFSGNGINPETDKYKDFIGHLFLKKSLLNEKLSLSGGFSLYDGGWAVQKPGIVYTFHSDTKSFVADPSYNAGDEVKRVYYDIDAQVSYQSNLGLTSLRAEYLWGKQPGTSSTSASPKGLVTEANNVIVKDTAGKVQTIALAAAKGSDVYLRDFSGGYIYFIQRIMKTKHELVIKYDWYDPNTKVSGNDIGNNSTAIKNPSRTGYTDVKYTTLGLGWNYYATENVKFTAYYDIVTNETTNSTYFTNDGKNIRNKSIAKDIKDNVLTLRVQYKF